MLSLISRGFNSGAVLAKDIAPKIKGLLDLAGAPVMTDLNVTCGEPIGILMHCLMFFDAFDV